MDGSSLRKDDRRRLLAELEETTSRGEQPEHILQRAMQALASRNLSFARRLHDQLTAQAPGLAGLDLFRDQMSAAEHAVKHEENVRTAETMLTGYIQQRKKQLALLALSTLRELEPGHPRLGEYDIWVRDLDQEVALQERIDALLSEGRAALQRQNLDAADAQLEALRRLDPHGLPTEQFAAEVDSVRQGRAAGETIQKIKAEIERVLAAGDTDSAMIHLDALRVHDVPKITVDQILRRIQDVRRRLDDEAEARTLTAQLESFLASGAWQSAREVAQQFGRRFPNDPRAAALFNRVTEAEANERRRQSIRQGVEMFEQLLARGDRQGAEMALGLLRKLEIDPASYAQLEARLRAG